MHNLSIVVATHNDPLGLYLTVHAILQQMEGHEEWELIIAADGGSPVKWEHIPNVRCLRIQTGSPQGTRDAGIRAAKYPIVLCVESHVIVSNIWSWRHYHISKGAAISFPARISETSELFTVTDTDTNWDGDLWIKKHYHKNDEHHRVVQFGHAAFMLDREWYLNSGGYTLLQKGWGGEEPYLCLKAWMTGKECWVFPDIWMAHYLQAGAHTGYRESEDFKRNIDIVKYVIAGQLPSRQYPPWSELLKEREVVKNGPFGGDLNKLKEYFRKEGIIT